MPSDGFIRHAIALKLADRDKLSTAAKTWGISQGDLISELIDFASSPTNIPIFQKVIERRVKAKETVRASRHDILKMMEGLNPDELAGFLKKVGKA